MDTLILISLWLQRIPDPAEYEEDRHPGSAAA
jgi:hypothetical protein